MKRCDIKNIDIYDFIVKCNICSTTMNLINVHQHLMDCHPEILDMCYDDSKNSCYLCGSVVCKDMLGFHYLKNHNKEFVCVFMVLK